MAPSGYVGQGNQAGNQGPAIRGIAPAGPPNQASTPPNTDLKVQHIPQQASMNPVVSFTLCILIYLEFWKSFIEHGPSINVFCRKVFHFAGIPV